MSRTKMEGEGRRSGSKLECVCECVCSLQLWNVESARRAQWHVWSQSEKEGSGTWRVRRQTEKKKENLTKEKGGGECEEESGMWEEGKAGMKWKEVPSQAYPGLCWCFNVTGSSLYAVGVNWGCFVKVCSHDEIMHMMQTGSCPCEDYLKHLFFVFFLKFCVIFVWNE